MISGYEQIGMVWEVKKNKNDDFWYKMYYFAKEYYLIHGDLCVPHNYSCGDGFKLGEWLYRQIRDYKNNSLSDERISLLEQIDVEWHSCYSNRKMKKWMKFYNLAKEFYLEHGHLKIVQSYVTEDGVPLGLWIEVQRQRYKNQNGKFSRYCKLTSEQVSLLNEIDMIWQIKSFGSHVDTWYIKYELAKKYYEENGNLDIPALYVTEDGTNLGSWLRNQKLAYRNISISKESRYSTMKPLSDEKVRLLEDIGIKWDCDTWYDKYDIAKEYFIKNGNLDVSIDFVYSGIKLGVWVDYQRYAYRNIGVPVVERKNTVAPLTDEQVDLLEQIGMVWSPRKVRFDDIWHKRYNCAKEYFIQNGNLDIPVNYVCEDGFKLGTWIHHQRQAYKNRFIPLSERTNKIAPLTDEKVNLLNEIYMIWDYSSNLYKTPITNKKRLKIEKIFLEVLEEFVKKHGNKINSYGDIEEIQKCFVDKVYVKK